MFLHTRTDKGMLACCPSGRSKDSAEPVIAEFEAGPVEGLNDVFTRLGCLTLG